MASKQDSIVKDITPWQGSSNSFVGWTADKTAIFILSNKRNKKFFDLWKITIFDWTPTLLYQNDTGEETTSVSKTQRYIALSKSITTDKNELYLLDLVNKKKLPSAIAPNRLGLPQGFEKEDTAFYFYHKRF